ncbi:MAG: hypothetical protein HY663_05140 [Chloroflexi bacterium]|nr:hypothetical protein [Chloroflexota bacterium]
MKKPKYQDFLKELSAEMRFGVFIDDTGSPGLTSSKLHPERKSWIAVIIPRYQMAEVLSELPKCLEVLNELVGATEFHFTDIYQGINQFKGVDLSVRLSLFEFMAHIFQVYTFPVIVQTFDPVLLNQLKEFPEKAGPFDLRKPSDAALVFLLIRVKSYMESRGGEGATARVFVDEGFRKNGTAICLPTFSPVFADGLVCFGSSTSILPLQLADFAAFVLNRQQLLINKDTLSDLDVSFLRIVESVSLNFQNIPVSKIAVTKRESGWLMP